MYQLGPHLKEGGFFGVPCVLIESKHHAKLPITARLVLIGLYQIAHRVSSPHFHAKESTLRTLFVVDRKTLRTALAALVKAEQLRHTAGTRGDPAEFWLYNPTTGELLPEHEGRATPTYNGVSKGSVTQLAPIAESSQTCTQTQAQPTQTEPPRRTIAAIPTRRDIPTRLIGPPPVPVRSGRLCNVPGHTTIHYRPDGSELCGTCHPTGITTLGSDAVSGTVNAPLRFCRPPTAKDLGFSSG